MKIFGGGWRVAVAGSALLVVVTGCGSTATEQGAGTGLGSSPRPVPTGTAAPTGTPSPTAAGSPVGFCPPLEAGPAPTPCITYSEAQRYAENHAYQHEMPLSASARADAQPRVQALEAALQQLAGAPLDEESLRRATAGATGARPETVHVELTPGGNSAKVVVEAGGGYVRGTVAGGRATVTGFIADGGCVAAVGH
ncbi:hypothetical protein [Kitasatospora sp. NPDC094015]|uniref:hypothetical protein n=1 Tax=Kitasatospora sp. NPDC094015 TaxID=3155205 RepID=UPI003326940E